MRWRTWDISKLATHARGVFLNLYLILDLFGLYHVAWMVALRETSGLAQQMIRHTIERRGIPAGELTLHNDRHGELPSPQPGCGARSAVRQSGGIIPRAI